MARLTASKQRNWTFRGIGLLLILLGCLLRISDPYPVQAARMIYFDYLQRLSPRDFNPELPVRVVDIDEASLSEIGHWPWPRTKLAELVQRLGEYGAAAIAFDMLFAEPDRYSPARLSGDPAFKELLRDDIAATLLDNDIRFANTIAEWPVVLGVAARLQSDGFEVAPKTGIVEIGERPTSRLPRVSSWTPLATPLGETALGIGGVNVSPLGGLGVVRTVPLLWMGPTGALPSLNVEVLRVATGVANIFVEGSQDEPGVMLSLDFGGFQVPTTENGEIWVRYRRDDPGLYLSAKDVLKTGLDSAFQKEIQGRIILVGTSAAGLLDIRETALGESVPGVSIHAQIIEQILLGEVLRRSDVTAALELIAFIALGLIVTSVMSGSGAVPSFVSGGIAAASVVGVSWFAFHSNSILFDVTFPLIGGMANFGLLAGYQYIVTERDKRAIRQTFSHYVAPEILDEMEASGQALKLGGETQDITVMFSDIRGFTPLSEILPASELVTLLNALFSKLGEQILAEKGTIDKFIGDAIMAFWNAPLPVEDHPARAVCAALAMRRAMAEFNASQKMDGQASLALATGCATGSACVGNIGSRKRFNYTAIGDVVNVASRLEVACRYVNYDIVVSKPVYEATKGKLAMLEAGAVHLRGKSEPESIFVVVGDQEVLTSQGFARLAEAHSKMMEKLQNAEQSRDMAALASDCAQLASKVEPGLAAFYREIPRRVQDFSQHIATTDIAFRHFERSRMAGE